MSSPDPRRALGATGERLARAHLEARGLTVVDANFRTPWRAGHRRRRLALRSSSARSRRGSRRRAGRPASSGRSRRSARASSAGCASSRASGWRAAAKVLRGAQSCASTRSASSSTARGGSSNRPPGGGVLNRIVRGEEAGRHRRAGRSRSLRPQARTPAPGSATTADRLARRLLHLRRGRPLAGQQRQPAPAPATAPTAPPTTARPSSARTTPPASTASARSTAATAPTSPRSRAPASRSPTRSTSPARAPPPRTSSAPPGRADGEGRAAAGRPAAPVAQRFNVKLVVLSIGGNDLGFADIVQACADRLLEPRRPASPRQQQAFDSKFNAAMFNVGKAIDEIRAVMSAAGYHELPVHAAELSVGVRRGRARTATPRPTRCSAAASAAARSTTRTPTGPATPSSARSPTGSGSPRLKGVQFLDLRDAFEGREICSNRRGRRRSTSRRRRPRASGGGS